MLSNKVKSIIISDTHNQHKSLTLPEGDLIIHAGDCTGRGTGREVEKFLHWFSNLDYQYKIMIAGNHDFYLEKIALDNPKKPKLPSIENYIPEGVIYLNDSGIEIEGIQFWGSPIQPWFYNWAFNRKRGAEIKKHWDLIPSSTDVLITHGPVYGILNLCDHGERVGCKDLLTKVNELNPSHFICGHIHEAYGVEKVGATTFINASVLDQNYKLKNEPIVIDL